MTTAEATKKYENNGSVNDAMDVLLSLLDEGIDDIENGRVMSVEEAWKEIDAIH